MKSATVKTKFHNVRPGEVISVQGTRFRINKISGRGYLRTYWATQLDTSEEIKASAPVDQVVDIIPDLYEGATTGGRWENPITGYMGATYTGD